MTNYLKVFLSLFVAVVSLFATSFSYAAPTQRGFQIPLNGISEPVLDDLIANWRINVVRVHVGDNANMDGLTDAAYDAMMESQFQLLDSVLPLFAARGLKMVFIMYSPPGGFETRESPSHYKMFSDATLGDAFIAKWQEIMARYGSNAAIAGFDIVNEPAMRKSLLGAGAKNWNGLLLSTIAAIRETHPTVPLFVKPLYGDPSQLTSLPAINDANVVYTYNAYFFNSYQQSGISDPPFSIAPPTTKAINDKLRRILASFYLKIYSQVEAKTLPATAFPPRLSVGEATISACATGASSFLSDLLTALETDESAASVKRRERVLREWKRARRNFRSLPKPSFLVADFKNDVAHDSYVVHAFNEARIWDPRYVCDASGNLTYSATETDREAVLKAFFRLNG